VDFKNLTNMVTGAAACQKIKAVNVYFIIQEYGTVNVRIKDVILLHVIVKIVEEVALLVERRTPKVIGLAVIEKI
jgi:hypothetical protein